MDAFNPSPLLKSSEPMDTHPSPGGPGSIIPSPLGAPMTPLPDAFTPNPVINVNSSPVAARPYEMEVKMPAPTPGVPSFQFQAPAEPAGSAESPDTTGFGLSDLLMQLEDYMPTVNLICANYLSSLILKKSRKS